MNPTLVRAETVAGHRFELDGVQPDEATGRRVASQVAAFLGRCGRPAAWKDGGRVTVSDLGSGRLLFVARVRVGTRTEAAR